MWCDQKNTHQVFPPEILFFFPLKKFKRRVPVVGTRVRISVLAMFSSACRLRRVPPLRRTGVGRPGDIPIQTGRAVEVFFFLKHCFAMFY